MDEKVFTFLLQDIHQTLNLHGTLMTSLHAKLDKINLQLSGFDSLHGTFLRKMGKSKSKNTNFFELIREICKATSNDLEEINVRLENVDTRLPELDSLQSHQQCKIDDAIEDEEHAFDSEANDKKYQSKLLSESKDKQNEDKQGVTNQIEIRDNKIETDKLIDTKNSYPKTSIDIKVMQSIKEYLADRINKDPVEKEQQKAIGEIRSNYDKSHLFEIEGGHFEENHVDEPKNFLIRERKSVMKEKNDHNFFNGNYVQQDDVYASVMNALNKTDLPDIDDRETMTTYNENTEQASLDGIEMVKPEKSAKIRLSKFKRCHIPDFNINRKSYCNRVHRIFETNNNKSSYKHRIVKTRRAETGRSDTNHNNKKLTERHKTLILFIDRQLQFLLRDVYDVVEKEAHLTRQILSTSNHDDRLTYEFHFRVMDFVRRVRSDVEVFSCPWFIPQLGTCVRGYVRFELDGSLLVSLSDGRFPKVVGVPPVAAATVTFTTCVCDAQGGGEDWVLAMDRGNVVDEANQRERYGVWGLGAGRPSCEDLLASGYVRRDFDVLLLKFVIKVQEVPPKIDLQEPPLIIGKTRDDVNDEVYSPRRRSDSLPKGMSLRRSTLF